MFLASYMQYELPSLEESMLPSKQLSTRLTKLQQLVSLTDENFGLDQSVALEMCLFLKQSSRLSLEKVFDALTHSRS